MELTFNQNGNKYEAEFVATSAFNLHLEREDNGYVSVYQRGTDTGEYASTESWGNNEATKVFDVDFASLVYPKYIKVVSRSKVNRGVVTF